MTPEELKQRGENAARLLGDKLLNETLDIIEQEVIALWGDCPARDTEGREELWKYYKVAKKFRGILQGTIESGKVVISRENEKSPFSRQPVKFTRR